MLIGLLFLGVNFIDAKKVTIITAEMVAKNFFFEKTKENQNETVFKKETVHKEQQAVYYVFNKPGGGFVLIAADDNYYPILGYSLENNFITTNQPSNVAQWLDKYAQDILILTKNKKVHKDAYLWEYYNKPLNIFKEQINLDDKNSNIVNPLTQHIKWDQGKDWNEFCPEDEDGPGGRVYAGCVATAMSIIMKYWNYPPRGVGNHFYVSNYGELFVNFEETTYMWNEMDTVEPTSASALLMYHAGVSVNMIYSPNDSGAYSEDVPYAMEAHFDYAPATYAYKNTYSLLKWKNEILKPQLDDGKPIFYFGAGDVGHAFVCDGYDEYDYFHFNFGWSGYNNGFYSLSDVGGFSSSQGAIVDIFPAYNLAADNKNMPEIITYPNPTNGIIHLSGLSFENILEVYDVNGTLIYKTENIQNNSTINLSHLTRGIYFLNIFNNNKYFQQKIVIE